MAVSGRGRAAVKAGEVMSAAVVTVPAEATIVEAATVMLDHGVIGVPVVDNEGCLVGIVSERDLFRRCEIGTEPDPSLHSPGPPSNPDTFHRFVKSHGHQAKGHNDARCRQGVRGYAFGARRRPSRFAENQADAVMRDGKIVGIVSRADLLRALVSAVGSYPLCASTSGTRRQDRRGVELDQGKAAGPL